MAFKDSGMRIRIEKDLREAFVLACRAQDRIASEVLRDFMRSFTDMYEANQRNLFPEPNENESLRKVRD